WEKPCKPRGGRSLPHSATRNKNRISSNWQREPIFITPVATQTMERTLPMTLQWDESFDIGSDTLTGGNDADSQPQFTFAGQLNELTIKVDRPQLSPEDVKKLEEAMQNNKASE